MAETILAKILVVMMTRMTAAKATHTWQEDAEQHGEKFCCSSMMMMRLKLIC